MLDALTCRDCGNPSNTNEDGFCTDCAKSDEVRYHNCVSQIEIWLSEDED